MPEWLNDGPTSMHDMIELRGFDDDNKITRKWEFPFLIWEIIS